jgi:hypothetical protein
VLATFISGLAAALAALVIQLEVLVEMMSIGKRGFMEVVSPVCDPPKPLLRSDK